MLGIVEALHGPRFGGLDCIPDTLGTLLQKQIIGVLDALWKLDPPAAFLAHPAGDLFGQCLTRHIGVRRNHDPLGGVEIVLGVPEEAELAVFGGVDPPIADLHRCPVRN